MNRLIMWTNLLGIVLIMTLFSNIVCAQPVEKHPVVLNQLPVFSEIGENGEFQGYSVELVKGIFRQAGLTPDLRYMPLARMRVTLREHPQTLALALARTPDREDDFYWITPVAANPATLFIKRDHPRAGGGPLELKDISSVSLLRNDFRVQILKDSGVKHVVELSSWGQAIEAVLRNRVEGVFLSRFGLAMVCERQRLDCNQLTEAVASEVAYSYLVLPKIPQNSELAAKLTIAASEYKSSDAFRELAAKTIPVFKRFGENVKFQDGVVNFMGKEAKVDSHELWVIADLVPYFAELGPRGNVEGYSPDLVRMILEKAGIEQEILAAPWERIVREAATKANILAFAVVRTDEREHMFHWITPITRGIHGLYGVSPEKVKHLDELPSASRIATLRKDYRNQVVEEAGLTSVPFDSWSAALAATLGGETDYIFASEGAIDVACQQLNKNCGSVHLVMSYRYITTYLVLSKAGTSTELVDRLRQAAVEVKKSEDYRQWAQNWSEQMRSQAGLSQHIDDGVVNMWKVQTEND